MTKKQAKKLIFKKLQSAKAPFFCLFFLMCFLFFVSCFLFLVWLNVRWNLTIQLLNALIYLTKLIISNDQNFQYFTWYLAIITLSFLLTYPFTVR